MQTATSHACGNLGETWYETDLGNHMSLLVNPHSHRVGMGVHISGQTLG